jgi:hypothetical protein
VPKLVLRVKLVAELRPAVTTETEVARIAREEDAGFAELGLWLEEAKGEVCGCDILAVRPGEPPVLMMTDHDDRTEARPHAGAHPGW